MYIRTVHSPCEYEGSVMTGSHCGEARTSQPLWSNWSLVAMAKVVRPVKSARLWNKSVIRKTHQKSNNAHAHTKPNNFEILQNARVLKCATFPVRWPPKWERQRKRGTDTDIFNRTVQQPLSRDPQNTKYTFDDIFSQICNGLMQSLPISIYSLQCAHKHTCFKAALWIST